MKFIAILFLIYAFIKSIYYAFFEIKEKENKPGGIFIIIWTTLGLIIPLILLILLY